jgi:4-amino-4-deoxy-L-arabinose transferase-like glycosyltransferase
MLVLKQSLRIVLALGIAQGVAVFLFQNPLNNDSHLAVVAFIWENFRLPRADELNQAYHPPLYYVLAAPWLGLGGLKVLQLFSLLCSLATRLVFYVAIRDLPFVEERQAKPLLLAFLVLLPQFTLHGNFVSNDPLTYLLAALAFLQAWRCLEQPSLGRACGLGWLVGLGLLTKAVFLVFLLPLALLLWVALSRRDGPRRAGLAVAAFLLLATSLGAYKFIENAATTGNAFFNNLDLGQRWVERQQPTYRDLRSYLAFDLPLLVRKPTVSAGSVHSMPMLLYGSFWYQFVPESNLRGNLSRLKALAGPIYLLGLVPTLLCALGALRVLRQSLPPRIADDALFRRRVYERLALVILAANVVLVVYVGLKYDVWSVYQSRLIFPSLLAAAVLMNLGLEAVAPQRGLARAVHALFLALLLLFFAYFATEAVYVAGHPVDPGLNSHLPYRVRMK